MDRKLKITVKRHYDSIYSASRKLKRALKTNRLPMVMACEVVERAKIEVHNDNLKKFEETFNRSLEKLQSAIKVQGKLYTDNSISLHEIKQMVKALKKGIDEIV